MSNTEHHGTSTQRYIVAPKKTVDVPAYRFKSQFNTLFRKNLAYQKKMKKTNFCQVCFPIFTVVLLVLLQVVVDALIDVSVDELHNPPNFPPYLLLPDHYAGRETREPHLLYGFDESRTNAALIGDYNTTHPSDSSGLFKFVTAPEIGFFSDVDDEFLYFDVQMPRTVEEARMHFSLNGISFVPPTPDETPATVSRSDVNTRLFNDFKSTTREWSSASYFEDMRGLEASSSPRRFTIDIFYNETISFGQDIPAAVNLIISALVKFLANDKGKSYSVELRGVREAPQQELDVKIDIPARAGPFFYIFVLQLMIPLIVGGIVYEKENKLREIMRMMGLKMEVYWAVNYVFSYFMYFVSALFLIIAGAIAGWPYFIKNDFGVYFLLFFFWGHALVALGFFLSVFFARARTATLFSYFFVIGSGIVAQHLVPNYVNDEEDNRGALFLVSLFPPFAFFRGLQYLTLFVVDGETGLKTGDLGDENVHMGDVYVFLVVEALVLLFVTYYLEQIWHSSYGVKRKWNFLFQKDFWVHPAPSPMKHKASGPEGDLELHTLPPMDDQRGKHADYAVSVPVEDAGDSEPFDVRTERTTAYNDDNIALRIIDLHKRYEGTDNQSDKVAVRNLALGIQERECFGLLGPNGAGKSTTINMLSGLFEPTMGTAFVFGMDIREDMDSIHMMMGVCPQDNILWGTLTAREHLLFFGRLKNLTGNALEDEIKSVLEKVNLWDVRNRMSKQYSGGMKRRLSVAIAIVGNPKVVFLDEPSTGLDPASRRNLWDVINEYKSKCSMILTTHSMEEADALCDRLGIFSNGSMRCCGTPADLKYRFGAGFRFICSSPVEYEEEVHRYVLSLMPGATLTNSFNGTRSYEVPRTSVNLAQVFTEMEQNKRSHHILDWGLSNTTLEEVFLNIVLNEET